MQTRKKVSSRNGVEELSSPRYRQHKKMSEHAQVAETKVADLITSSTRKPRYGTFPKKTRDIKNVKKVKASYILAGDEDQEICLLYDTIDGVSIGHQGFDERNAECEDTLFFPTYHVTKDAVGLTPNRDFVEVFKGDDKTCHLQTKDLRVNITNYPASFESSDSLGREDHRSPIDDVITDAPPTFPCNMNMDSSVVYSKETEISNCNEYKLGDNLSSEVSAIYLAMQQSKLECVDEISEDSMSVEVNVEADEDDEVDDFDPYLFIRNLPELSAVVPTFRPMLLPKQTRRCPPTTLVLDLDETLVHSSLEHCDNADFTFQVNFNLMQHTVYVRCRPHLKDFMERVASLFEIIVFTASQSVYAEQLLNVLDPKRRLFRHRVFRDSCVFVEGNYLKDLSVLGRDLARVVIIDNSPQAFGFQVDNGVPILSWFQDPSDCELLELLPFLESLVGVEDVRPIIAKRFNLREKVASAVDPFNRLE